MKIRAYTWDCNGMYEHHKGPWILRRDVRKITRGKLAARISSALEEDFTDRLGLRQEWERIDSDTKKEIRKTWRAIIRCVIRKEFET